MILKRKLRLNQEGCPTIVVTLSCFVLFCTVCTLNEYVSSRGREPTSLWRWGDTSNSTNSAMSLVSWWETEKSLDKPLAAVSTVIEDCAP